MSTEPWKKCGTCKKPIAYGQKYWKCNVSTCNRARFQLVFCTLHCWDAHVPVMNHRSAWADEMVAPSRPQPAAGGFAALPSGGSAPRPRAESTDQPRTSDASSRRRVSRPDAGPATDSGEKDILIVASKLKNYIRKRSGMNTSADVLEVLSDEVRALCDDAIHQAGAEGRKTVKGRDFR
ncbi:MAG: hypothetical protein QGG40_22715 [Myxococcota bacterium]|nr:hypothetical protein [Myxococcota bacterium]